MVAVALRRASPATAAAGVRLLPLLRAASAGTGSGGVESECGAIASASGQLGVVRGALRCPGRDVLAHEGRVGGTLSAGFRSDPVTAAVSASGHTGVVRGAGVLAGVGRFAGASATAAASDPGRTGVTCQIDSLSRVGRRRPVHTPPSADD